MKPLTRSVLKGGDFMDMQEKEKTIGVKFVLSWAIVILSWIVALVLFLTGSKELFEKRVFGVFSILAGLVIFPPFAQFVRHKTGFKLSTVLSIVLFVVLLGIGAGLDQSTNKSDSSKPTQEAATVSQTTASPSPIVLDASVFVGEYDRNKVGADAKFTGKRIQFTAFIKNISSDIIGKYYISLEPTNSGYYFGTSMECYFTDKAQLINLSNGQAVTVEGTAQDMSFGIVQLKDCIVVK